MFLAGKFARPISACNEVQKKALVSAIQPPFGPVVMPANSVLPDSLAATINSTGFKSIWLRLDKFDRDPAVLFASLLAAFNQNPNSTLQNRDRYESISRNILDPGYPFSNKNLPGQYHDFGVQMGQCYREQAALVLEDIDQLANAPESAGFLFNCFLKPLIGCFPIILLSSHPWRGFPGNTQADFIPVDQLSLAKPELEALCAEKGGISPGDWLAQTAGRMHADIQAIDGICRAIRIFGDDEVKRLVSSCVDPGEVRKAITRQYSLLQTSSGCQALGVLAWLGYIEHTWLADTIDWDPVWNFPGSLSLEDGWLRIIPAWRESLIKTLPIAPNCESVFQDVSEYLCREGACLEGIGCYFELDNPDQAASWIEASIATLFQYGAFTTIADWLDRLPATQFHLHPGLLRAQAQLLANKNKLSEAGQVYSLAVDIFTQKGNIRATAECLLAASSLNLRRGLAGPAWSNALHARKLAEEANLNEQIQQANTLLGALAAESQDYDSAKYFLTLATQSAENSGDQHFHAFVKPFLESITDQVRLHHERQIQQNAYEAALTAEIEHNRQVRLELASFGRINTLLIREPGHPPRWTESWIGLIDPIRQILQNLKNRAISPQAILKMQASQSPGLPVCDLTSPIEPGSKFPDRLEPVTQKACQLRVYFFDHFQLAINDFLINPLPAARTSLIFKYLLYHHKRRIERDELLETFWPEADPETARNRLNVALSSLRKSLRAVTNGSLEKPFELVLFDDGRYTINPALEMWVDIEQFEHYIVGITSENGGALPEPVIQKLETAVNIYRGDFLPDDQYEEWTIPIRERLRLNFLDALSLLSRHYYHKARYTACVETCKLILERDDCREDIHRMLMRCYAQQDQYPLALRQYQVCVENLSRELDVKPALSTIALYEKLRQREKIT